MVDVLRSAAVEAELRVRSEPAREVDLRIMRWGVDAETLQGRERFVRGAFRGVDPSSVTLEAIGAHGAEPGVRLAGRGLRLEEGPEYADMTFRVARTAAGDELLELAGDGVYRGASVVFAETPGGSVMGRDGVIERRRVDLRRVGIVERPAYEGAAVLAVRSEEGSQMPTIAETEPTPTPAPTPPPSPDPAPDPEPIYGRIDALRSDLMARMATLEAGAGSHGGLMGRSTEFADYGSAQVAAFRDPILARALADEITSENPGVIHSGWLEEIRSIFPPRRPAVTAFGGPAALPDSGMDFYWPTYTGDIRTLVQRQAAEKTAIHTEKISFGRDGTTIESYGFGHDVSYQLMLRSTPSYVAMANRVLLAAFAYYQDASFIAALVAADASGGYVPWDPAASDPNGALLRAALFSASMQVEAATGAPATFGLAATDVFGDIGAAPGLYPSTYGTQNISGTAQASTLRVNVSGLEIYHDPNLPSGSFLVSNGDAARYHADGPRFVTAEDVERLGRNEAIWGMGASAIYVPAGIVWVAAVAPTAAGEPRTSSKSKS